jgi:hypothetical protein
MTETFIFSAMRAHSPFEYARDLPADRKDVIYTAHDHLPFITCVDELAMFETMVQAMRVGPGRGTTPAAAATVLNAMK